MAKHRTYLLSPSDRELAQGIEHELHRDPLAGKEFIDVDVCGGHATLRGHVATYAAKLAAAEAARQVPGVVTVAADLNVEPLALGRCTDEKLRDAALEALHWKACLPTHALEVSVRDGCVALEGRVDWTYQKLLAERTLALLPGVTSIRNSLRVGDQQTQMEVMTRIRAALRNAAETQADALDVSVCEGTVTLRGTLPTNAVHAVVSTAVRSHPEVHVVRDELHVVAAAPPGTPRRTSGEPDTSSAGK